MEAAENTIGLPRQNSSQDEQIETYLLFINLSQMRKKKAEDHLEEVLKLFQQSALIDSIDGVGLITAGAIVAALGDLRQYGSWKQVLKKAGLNLYSYESGGFRGKNRISKRANSLLRKYLFMFALSHTIPGHSFYEKYDSMVKRGVSKMKILVAIMRKILKISYALVRDNSMFEKNYEKRA